MWVLVENSDSSVDIVEDTKIVTDSAIEVGQSVTVLYQDPKRRKKNVEFQAKILNISESKAFLEGMLEEYLASTSTEAVECTTPAPAEKAKPTASRKQKGKKENRAEIATAKFILEQMSAAAKASVVGSPPAEVDFDEVRRLRKENSRLRKERDDAIEIKSLLHVAQELVSKLKGAADNPPSPCSSADTVPYQEPPKKARPYSPPSTLEPQDAFCGYLRPKTPLAELNPSQQFGARSLSPIGPPDRGSSTPNDLITMENSLKYSKCDENVCELMPGSGVYVPASALSAVQRGAKNPSTVARQLMEAVFTLPALEACSVRGKVAKGPLGRPAERRCALNQAGVEAILAFTAQHSAARGWNPHPEPSIIRAMGTKLCEIRLRND